MEKRVLITGGTGFIGTNLRKLYPDADILDKSQGQDICDKLPDKHYDEIFHLAAKQHIPTCEKEAKECIRVNCWGTMNLIRTYRDSRILIAGSSSANDVKSVYAATKAFLEVISPLHPNCLVVKFYNVFGEHQKLEGGAVTPNLIYHYLTKKELTINGDGTQARDFTYVGDIVENLKLLMNSDRRGVCHLGYGEPITLNSYIEMIYGYMPDVLNRPKPSFEILHSKSPEQCKIFYGREKGMRRTIEWFKEHYGL